MRCELPVLLRCCFCFPLRIGLLVWAYLKQGFSIFFLTFLCLKLYHEQVRGRMNLASAMVSSTTIIILILDIVFHLLFIISAHTKEYKKMRIFYRYSIYALCLNVVILGIYIGMWCFYISIAPFMIIFMFSIILPSLLMILLSIFLQGYLIILVRSEFVKLKNNSQFEFVNHAADVKCTANLDFVKEIPVTV